MKRCKRIVIARLGSEAQGKGIITVARALRDAGMEVIYLGNQPPEGIVMSALQEDADVVGLSCLSDSYKTLAPEVVKRLRAKDAGDIPVVLGGTVPPEDIAALKAAGVAEVFGPGTPLERIVAFIETLGKD